MSRAALTERAWWSSTAEDTAAADHVIPLEIDGEPGELAGDPSAAGRDAELVVLEPETTEPLPDFEAPRRGGGHRAPVAVLIAVVLLAASWLALEGAGRQTVPTDRLVLGIKPPRLAPAISRAATRAIERQRRRLRASRRRARRAKAARGRRHHARLHHVPAAPAVPSARRAPTRRGPTQASMSPRPAAGGGGPPAASQVDPESRELGIEP
jgi:hypothetical protein